MILKQKKQFPTLTTSRLLLREATLADTDAYHRLLSERSVSNYSDIPANPTKKRSERFVSWMSKLHKRRVGCAWIIENQQDHTLLGAIRINSIEKKIKAGLIGYELHPQHWSNGYASEALDALVEYAHDSLELNRLEAWTVPGNTPSERVLLKNGFVQEGLQRQKVKFNNRLHDIKLFARLAADDRIREPNKD